MPRPYTYLLINSKYEWYIGVRMKNVKLGLTAEQDTFYMSSSEYVATRIETGEKFSKLIIAKYETNEEACANEKALLREHWDEPGRINKNKGSGLSYVNDEETREKHRLSLLGHEVATETRNKIATALTGGKRSKETKLKMSERKLGKEVSNNWKPCTIDGITIFASQKEAIKAIGTSRKTGVRSPNFRYVVEK